MSFAGNIKEELSRMVSPSRHCRVAELASIISMCGAVAIDSRGDYILKIHTENIAVARKYFTLVQKTFNIKTDTSVRVNREKGSVSYYVVVKNHEDARMILETTKLIDAFGEIEEELDPIKNKVIRKLCCKQAFLQGAFLSSGSVSDPEKSYHFEIVCASRGKAEQLQQIMNFFRLDAKIVSRKRAYVVYLKEGAQIVDALGILGASVSMEAFEDVRTIKDMRNTVNRKVNCETANINKTVSAAIKQMEDIRFIDEEMGIDKLPENLMEVAVARLNYPEASLKELGSLLKPPVGKSGVNHRLRKLSEISESLKAKKED